MKTCIFLFLSLFSFSTFYFQDTATDFTASDCDGIIHNLFSELDSGKVIVLTWVMPCGPCATHAINAYSAASNFQTTNPNRVKFYLIDDFANTSCQSLLSWGDSYGLDSATLFSNPDIDMNDYGQIGMPKIVVVGGAQHKIYFNENSSTFGINVAIQQALNDLPNMVPSESGIFKAKLFPNPATHKLKFIYTNKDPLKIKIEIFNMLGERILKNYNVKDISTIGSYEIDVSSFHPGSYLLKYSTTNQSKIIKFNIVH